MMRGALVAGAILAFALSFDEIVVTTFTAGPSVQTLPDLDLRKSVPAQPAPVINVVARRADGAGDHSRCARARFGRRSSHHQGCDVRAPSASTAAQDGRRW